MRLFWEFFFFELKFRFKSISTYVYFAVWLVFSFLCVSSENFGGVASGNGKVLVNGPWANISNDITACVLRNHHHRRHLWHVDSARFPARHHADPFHQADLQIRLSRRTLAWVVCASPSSCFFAMIPGEMLGTLAPWADHTRIAHASLSWYFQPFFSIIVVQIFFLGSLFFLVAALSRRVFIVYLQGAAVFALYLFYVGVFINTRSLNRFWPGIFDPVGILVSDAITRYWTVVDKNTLMYSWSPHVAQGLFLYNRLFWCGFGILTLAALWIFFPMSLETLTARTSSRRAEIAAEQDEEMPPRRYPRDQACTAHPSDLWSCHHVGAVLVAHAAAHAQHRARYSLLGAADSNGWALLQQWPLRR